MRHITFALLIIPCSIGWASSPDEIRDAVDSIAREAIDKDSTVGLSIAVAEGDRVLVAKGYGFANVELQSPASAQTVYRIGSITKQFTAAAIMLLVEDGKLGLDDPLSSYVPEYPPQDHVVTIRHLLQHTSGIKSFTGLPLYRQLMRRDVTHADIVERFADQPLQFKPGTQYRYSNSGFYLLGMVIENVSGKRYEEFLQQRIFSPLKMEHTYYDRHAKIIAGRAQGYSRWGGKLRNASYLSMTQPFSAGALATNVEDLVRWQQALIENSLLRPDSYSQMTTAGSLSSGKQFDYGLGFVVRERKGRVTIGHGGGINGFRSSLIYYPETDHTIVVLANSESAQPAAISAKISDLLLKTGDAEE